MLPLNYKQLVIGLEWVSEMLEDRWMSFQKLSSFVSDLRGCIPIPIPHILHAPGVLDNVRWHAEVHREWHLLDPFCECLRAQASRFMLCCTCRTLGR